MTKQALRQHLKTIISKLKQRKAKNKLIFNKIIQLKLFKKAENIFTYVSKEAEVDTKNLINYALKKGKKIFVPKINLKNNKIEIYKITSLKELQKGSYDIDEPSHNKSKRKTFDIIFIPGIAFDINNNRLGRGGGFFDKFLRNIKGIKIGLCFQEQLLDKLPVEKHDIKMDIIISD